MDTYVSHDRQEPGRVSPETPSLGSSSPPGDRSSAVRGALYVQGMVAEFHQVFGCATSVPLISAPDELIDLRIDLIEEELREVLEAMQAHDLLAVARELADLTYVAVGTAVAFGLTLRDRKQSVPRSLVADCGSVNVTIALRSRALTDALSQLMATLYRYALLYEIDLDAAVTEVHRANLSKLGDDGRPVLRPDGKVLKGPNFREPDMCCALVDVLPRTLRDDFTVPVGTSPEMPPWWLDGIETGR
jgi:predicted HAD superfamily Cof-like phosphohydrolase